MIYVIQHCKGSTPGSTILYLEKRGIPYQICKLHLDEPLPKIENISGLILCGGGMDVDQEDHYSFLRPEKALLKEVLAQHKIPVLGLCLGGQLIAETLGARVSKHPVWEIGWHEVQLRELDPKLGQKLLAFQWHGYSFDTPKEAIQIAESRACAHQGFIWNTRVVGLQFHPETSEEWIQECVAEAILETGEYVETKEAILEKMPERQKLQNWYFQFLDLHFTGLL